MLVVRQSLFLKLKDTKNFNSPNQIHKFEYYFQSNSITSVSIDEMQKDDFPLEGVMNSGKDLTGFIKQHCSDGDNAASRLK